MNSRNAEISSTGSVYFMIIAAKPLMENISQYCISKLPNEACGFLLGKYDEHMIVIERFKAIDNIARDQASMFLFNPSQWVPLLYDAMNSRIQVAGIFHSHPRTP